MVLSLLQTVHEVFSVLSELGNTIRLLSVIVTKGEHLSFVYRLQYIMFSTLVRKYLLGKMFKIIY